VIVGAGSTQSAPLKVKSAGGGKAPWAMATAAAQQATHDKWDAMSIEAGKRVTTGVVHLGVPGHTTTLVNTKLPLSSRPSASSMPADINAWCQNYGVPPLFAYPEFGWKMVPDGTAATAAYDMGAGDHVAWTTDIDGSWTYTHTWGGVDVGRLISDIAILASSIPAIGPWVGMAIDTALAIVNGESISDIGAALKNDWDAAMATYQTGYAVLTGNWQGAWDAATQQGKNLAGLLAAWSPNPAPDRFGNETIQLPAPIDVADMPPPLSNPIAPGLASVAGHPAKKPRKGKGSARRARRGR